MIGPYRDVDGKILFLASIIRIERSMRNFDRTLVGFLFSVAFITLGSVNTYAQKAPQRVSGPQMSTLIRTTMVAVDHANKTGNYTVLRDLGSRTFRARNAADLSDLFGGMRKQKTDLSQTVLLDPQIIGGPKLTTNGKLTLNGFFELKPRAVTFEVVYLFEQESWKIGAISIGFKQNAATGGNAARRANLPLPAARPNR